MIPLRLRQDLLSMLDPPKADKYLLTCGEFDEKQTQPQILHAPNAQLETRNPQLWSPAPYM